mgnify:CR=1 FL=1
MTLRAHVATVGRTLGTLGLLTATLPVDTALTVAALATRRWAGEGSSVDRRTFRRDDGPLPSDRKVRWVSTDPDRSTDPRRTVLVTGAKMTKALVVARAFAADGHRVVLAETARYRWTAHRFSRAVDAFHVLPDPGGPGWEEALAALVRAEGIDTWVPVSSPASALPEAIAARVLAEAGLDVEVVHLDPDRLHEVDDKHAFAVASAAAGLPVPDTHRITDPQQVLDFDFAGAPARRYVLKSIAYDPVRRLDLTPLPRPTRAETAAFVAGLPIDADHPWILQELLEGEEYCTHGTVRDGRLQVHVCCRSSPWQLVYEQVDHPGIRDWVERFVAADPGRTGQVSLDFIDTVDGVRAIECNPRTHSALSLLDGHPGLAAAYVEARDTPLEPPVGGRPTYWTYHELWQGLRHPRTLPGRLALLVRGRDAVWSWQDPVPFWMLHHVHVPSLLVANLLRLRPWLRVDLNIGKLVEPGGD